MNEHREDQFLEESEKELCHEQSLWQMDADPRAGGVGPQHIIDPLFRGPDDRILDTLEQAATRTVVLSFDEVELLASALMGRALLFEDEAAEWPDPDVAKHFGAFADLLRQRAADLREMV
jgi:hypothetical protein